MKRIQVTHFFEDTGFCKDVFQSVSQPYYYCNRDTENGIWYTSTPDLFENDCRIRKDVIIEVISGGQIIAQDGNGDFDGKTPFLPFHKFVKEVGLSFQKSRPHLHGYEEMKEKLLSLPGGEEYSNPHSCYDNWLFALNFGHETECVVETVSRMKQEYHILAVEYTHRPTGFVFTNYRLRAAFLQPKATSHDLLLYDWMEEQEGSGEK